MKNALIQIGRTALLCGILGVALYVCISYAAGFPAFAPGLALAGSIVCVWLTISSIRYALRHRLIPAKSHSIFRDKQPVLYWGLLGLDLAAGGVCIALAILSAARLIEAIGNGQG